MWELGLLGRDMGLSGDVLLGRDVLMRGVVGAMLRRRNMLLRGGVLMRYDLLHRRGVSLRRSGILDRHLRQAVAISKLEAFLERTSWRHGRGLLRCHHTAAIRVQNSI